METAQTWYTHLFTISAYTRNLPPTLNIVLVRSPSAICRTLSTTKLVLKLFKEAFFYLDDAAGLAQRHSVYSFKFCRNPELLVAIKTRFVIGLIEGCLIVDKEIVGIDLAQCDYLADDEFPKSDTSMIKFNQCFFNWFQSFPQYDRNEGIGKVYYYGGLDIWE